MTDKDIADKVYIEPVTVEVVEQLILKEQPDSVADTGRTGWSEPGNGTGRSRIFKRTQCPPDRNYFLRQSKAEDRLEFQATMEKIGEPVAASLVVENVEDGLAFANKIGYPVVLRPAYTHWEEAAVVSPMILNSWWRSWRTDFVFPYGQVLVERCIAGWKEIEIAKVMRDEQTALRYVIWKILTRLVCTQETVSLWHRRRRWGQRISDAAYFRFKYYQ